MTHGNSSTCRLRHTPNDSRHRWSGTAVLSMLIVACADAASPVADRVVQPAASAELAVTYTAVNVFPQEPGAEATGINDAGSISGTIFQPNGRMAAFLRSHSGYRYLIGNFPGGAGSNARAVNFKHEVAGFALTGSGQQRHAFYWEGPGRLWDLGTLGGVDSEAHAINNLSQVVGWSATRGYPNTSHAFLWSSPTQPMRDLGSLGSGFSAAWGVNDRGWVVGNFGLLGGVTHAFLWTPETGMEDIGSLGGNRTIALGINNRGEVVGQSDVTGFGPTHAFLWTRARGMQDLGLLGGVFQSGATDINDRGFITGYTVGIGTHTAFVRTPAGTVITLGDLGGGFGRGLAINSCGQVAGFSGGAGGGGALATLWDKRC